MRPLIRATGEAAGYTVTIEEHEGNIHRQQNLFQEAMEDENTAAIICDTREPLKPLTWWRKPRQQESTVLINTGIDVEKCCGTDSYRQLCFCNGGIPRGTWSTWEPSGLYVEILGDTWNINAFQATTAFHDVASEYGDLLMDRQAIGSEYDLEDSKEDYQDAGGKPRQQGSC